VPVKAVVDTSVLVSAFLNPSGYPAQVVEAVRRGRFVLLMSPLLAEELYEVLARPRVLNARKSQPSDTKRFVQDLLELTEVVEITSELHLCRDEEDDMVLETALVGRATHLVSRDADIVRSQDLIRHLGDRGVRVTTVSQFLRELENADEP
jgi:putative PIN family toxin of toxin-antitoxin system